MRTRIVIGAGVGLNLLLLGCHSLSPSSPAPLLSQTTKLAPTSRSVTSQTVRWPIPPGLPTFGEPSETSIRIAIFGMQGAVRRPGYYNLPKGSAIRDAVKAAQGL